MRRLMLVLRHLNEHANLPPAASCLAAESATGPSNEARQHAITVICKPFLCSAVRTIISKVALIPGRYGMISGKTNQNMKKMLRSVRKLWKCPLFL